MDMRGFVKTSAAIAGLLCLTLIWIGCGDDAAGPPANDPPTITLINQELAVGKGALVILDVSVSDPDNDPLTVTWSATGGSLRAQDQGSTQMYWTASPTLGVDTIKAVVSDGQVSRNVEVEFKIGTKVVADIAGVVNWTLAESPYIVHPPEIGGESRLAVMQASTLNIPSGVVVYTKPGLIFDVAGNLVCRGGSGSEITFYPNLRVPAEGTWFGFRVQTANLANAGFIDMEYTEVAYGTRTRHAIDGGNVYLKNTLLLFASEAGLYFESSGYAKLDGCGVTDNMGHGIWVDGGLAFVPDSVVVVDSDVSVNGLTGISLNFNDQDALVPVRIYHNTILRNLSHGIHLLLPVRPVINQNAIHSNDRAQSVPEHRQNIVLEATFEGHFPNIDATNNYWLTTDPLVIAGAIFDSADNPPEINVAVLYDPVLLAWP